MNPDLSPKQRDFYFNSNAAINIADGAVRSGKTYSALWRFIVHCTIGPPGDMMMLGRTRETVERNAISELRKMIGPKRVRYNRGTGHLTMGNRLVHVVGVNDAQAETKIRGSTLAGSYWNELSVLEQRAFEQGIDRHSVEGAKIFADTNPDSPFHWLNTEFFENPQIIPGVDLSRWQFHIDDNPILPKSYVERIKRVHTGVWYKRMVEGLWVLAEGMVYDSFDADGPMVVDVLPATFEQVIVGVDYGTSNPTVFLKLGRSKGKWYVFDEYYYDSKQAGRQKTDAEYAADFVEWIQPHTPSFVEVDPSAASFKLELKRSGVSGVRDAENEVLDGIRRVAVALNDGALYIARRCQETIKSLSVYAWDAKAQEQRGEDKPLKQNDHPADALRYAGYRVFGELPAIAPAGVGTRPSYWLSAP